jgi:hypothetical protein
MEKQVGDLRKAGMEKNSISLELMAINNVLGNCHSAKPFLALLQVKALPLDSISQAISTSF